MFYESRAHILNGFEGFNGCCHAAKGGEVWIKALFKDKLVTTETTLNIQQPPKHCKTETQRDFTVNANWICGLTAAVDVYWTWCLCQVSHLPWIIRNDVGFNVPQSAISLSNSLPSPAKHGLLKAHSYARDIQREHVQNTASEWQCIYRLLGIMTELSTTSSFILVKQ